MLYWRVSRQRLINMKNKQAIFKTLLLIVVLLCPGYSFAQTANESSGESVPVDIKANEQQFLDKEIVAKGNVRVKYKESDVTSDEAIMYRDDEGNAQKAVFKGSPKLVQKNSTMLARTLIFEIANQKIIANGNAHSVIVSTPQAKQAGDSLKANKKDDKKPAKPGDDNIITDSDDQIYDKEVGEFRATGHVRVKRGDLFVKAENLIMYYGTDGNPETAMFKGNVYVLQYPNETYSDNVTYGLNTNRLQANGHVKSKVIQNPKNDSNAKKNSEDEKLANNSEEKKGSSDIVVTSDAQDYSSTNGRITAIGNVKLSSDETSGAGPKMVMMRNEETGKTDRIIFYGRSQVRQTGKSWIADHIEMDMATKKVLASGNTKAVILQMKKKSPTETPKDKDDNGDMQLATKGKAVQ